MALSPWQKHVKSVLLQGGTMKDASKSYRGKPAGKNPRGVPLSSKTGKYRPSVPKGPMKKVVGAVKKQYKKALAKASKIGRKKATKPATKRRSSPPRQRRVDTASGARDRAYERWEAPEPRPRKRKKKASKNPGLDTITAVVFRPVSKDTLKQGAGVLAGAIVATGAPTLLPAWNMGYMGIGLSLLGAGLASAAAGFVVPELAASVAAGGVVVVGLRLVAQFVPRALRWAAPPPPAATAGLAGRRPAAIAGWYASPPQQPRMLPAPRSVPSLVARPTESFRTPRI
jgi:hypothetical protein